VRALPRRLPLPWERTAPDPERIPFLLAALGASAALALVGPVAVGGLRLSGWAWALALGVSAAVLAKRARLVSLPWLIWLPWVAMLAVRLSLTDFPALHRTVQVLSPLAVGAAVSTLRPAPGLAARLLRLARPALLLLAGVFAVRSGLLLTGAMPGTTGLAAESMMVTFLAVVFAAEWHGGDRRALRWWLGAVATTVFTVTRTTMAATVLTLPASLAPVRPARRVALAALVAVLALGIFSTGRVQRKSFESGAGTVEDLLGSEFRDSGRFQMWRLFRERIAERPWAGWGAGGGQAYARSITSGRLAYPHNDWLQNTFDYGYPGSALYLLTMAAAALHALLAARRAEGAGRTLLVAGASGFPVYWVLMYGDNAMSYVAFFGNYHLALLGLGYALLAARREREADAAAGAAAA